MGVQIEFVSLLIDILAFIVSVISITSNERGNFMKKTLKYGVFGTCEVDQFTENFAFTAVSLTRLTLCAKEVKFLHTSPNAPSIFLEHFYFKNKSILNAQQIT